MDRSKAAVAQAWSAVQSLRIEPKARVATMSRGCAMTSSVLEGADARQRLVPGRSPAMGGGQVVLYCRLVADDAVANDLGLRPPRRAIAC